MNQAIFRPPHITGRARIPRLPVLSDYSSLMVSVTAIRHIRLPGYRMLLERKNPANMEERSNTPPAIQ